MWGWTVLGVEGATREAGPLASREKSPGRAEEGASLHLWDTLGGTLCGGWEAETGHGEELQVHP